MLTYASPLAICFSGEGWLLSCGAKCLPGISSVALPPSAVKCVLQEGGFQVTWWCNDSFKQSLSLTRLTTFRSETWPWRMLMSTGASPPTRTERPPSPYRSLLQKVSPSASSHTRCELFSTPMILFSLRVFPRSASGKVWVWLCLFFF